jgi:hypothetical protein
MLTILRGARIPTSITRPLPGEASILIRFDLPAAPVYSPLAAQLRPRSDTWARPVDLEHLLKTYDAHPPVSQTRSHRDHCQP